MRGHGERRQEAACTCSICLHSSRGSVGANKFGRGEVHRYLRVEGFTHQRPTVIHPSRCSSESHGRSLLPDLGSHAEGGSRKPAQTGP